MTPGEASEAGARLAIDVGGHVRRTDTLVDTEDGIAFLDDGWPDNDTGHWAHSFTGTITDAGDGWLLELPGGEEWPIWIDGEHQTDIPRSEAEEALETALDNL